MFNPTTAIDDFGFMYCKHELEPNNRKTRYYFKNGFGASVVCHENSYGGNDGLFEMALLKGDTIHYIEDSQWFDVRGYLTLSEVFAHLKEIAEF